MAQRSTDPLLRSAEKDEPFDLRPHLPLQNPVIPSLIDASGQKDYGGREAHQGLEHGPNVGAFGIVIEQYATLLADKFKAVLKARKYFDHSLDGQCRHTDCLRHSHHRHEIFYIVDPLDFNVAQGKSFLSGGAAPDDLARRGIDPLL